VFFEKRYLTPEFNGTFRIQNRYFYTHLDQCSFTYTWIRLQDPSQPGITGPGSTGQGQILNFGIPEVDPLEPGQYGSLQVPLFDNWREADVLYVEAKDPYGRLIHRWSWPVKSPLETREQLLPAVGEEQVRVSEQAQSVVLESGAVRMEVSKQDGMLILVSSGGKEIPLTKGPVFREDRFTLKEFRHFDSGGSHHLVADFGTYGLLEWIMHPGGLVDMNLTYQPLKNSEEGNLVAYTGVSFSFPEEQIQGVTYQGNGPYRVWKNRKAGVNFHVWEKEYNNSITGHSGFSYPEFKGYYSKLYWARFLSKQAPAFTVYSSTEDLFLRLFTPEEAPNPARTTVKHPGGELSFMLGIPAIGTKFKEAPLLGPQSRPYSYLPRRVADGALRICLTFDFR